ncbi:MAG: CDP-alcohol phosphatidyltransferase family protein [Defluviitaleaceae bacterium]|nr:CDP-alcohol phosphatidyltransferase family protein [Defluviitaleaceae bacterium]
MKLRHIPNALGFARIIMVAMLIFVPPLTALSIALFVAAGVTDMIDGAIARRIKGATSHFGAELDSMADMFMVIVSVFFILPAFDIWSGFWIAILIALSFKLMSAVPGIIKHRKVFFLHTISNKLLGLVLFVGGILYFIFGGILAINIYFVFLVVAVFIITTEEMVIISMLDYPNKNIRGFWQIKRINEEYRTKGIVGI